MTSLTEILVNLPLLASILLKITIVLVVSWFLHLILAKRNPRWRLLLWRCAITGLVLIPILVPFGYLQVSITPPPEPVAITTPQPALQQPIIENPVLLQAQPVPISEPIPISESEVFDISQPSFSLTAWLQANIWMLVSVCWGSIAIILILRLLVGFIRIKKRIVSSLPGPEHLQQLLDTVANDLGCTQKIELRYTPDMSTPFLAGLLRPIIILPERMIDEKYRNKWKAIFAHEAAHLKSHDLVWMFVTKCFEAILWFHPLVWRLRNSHSAACEEVCDAVAADYIGNTESYSNTLANLALEVIGKVPVIGGIPMARSSEIIERLRILKQRIYPTGLARRWIILSGFVSFIALTLIGGLSLVYAESETGVSAARVLHFPKDRSLGYIKIMDANIKRQIQTSHIDSLDSVGQHDWFDWMLNAEFLGQAQGDVIIPAGKKAALFLNKDAFKDLSPLLNLKPDDLYMLSHPPTVRNQLLSSKCMQHIAHLTGLKDLKLYGAKATSEAMKHITKLQSLEMLHIPKGLTNKDLLYVTELKSLKRLYFNENRITNVGLKLYLPKLIGLEELTLWSGRINDAGLVYLADLPKLSFLSLRSGNFTNAGLIHLKKCPSLRILDLMHLPITDAGLQYLSGHPRLENLRLYNTQVTDKGLEYLKSLPSLKKLDIGGRDSKPLVTDAGMAHLAQINSLEYLDLPNFGITDRGMKHIANLKNLKQLGVGCSTGSPLNDTALQHLSKLQSLEYLHIGGTGFTDAGMDDLSKLTNLKELHFSYPGSITSQGLAKLKTLKSLERLYFNGRNMTISDLSALNVLENISDLQVDFIKQDNSGLDISGLTNLERLLLRFKIYRRKNKLVGDPARDEDLACLQKLKNLRFLNIGGDKKSSEVTDAGIAYLKDLPALTELYCGSPYLTDKSLSYLANIKTLKVLIIYGNFTDKGLGYLEGLKSLRSLSIYSANNFSPKALKQFKQKHPNLSSFTVEQDRELKRMPKKNPNSSKNSAIAPPFSIKTLDDKNIKLEDYKGKVVVLYFWATWCRPCIAGTPELKNIYTDFKTSFGDDFELISLSMDDNDSLVREHVKKYDLTWPQTRIGLYSKISSDYGVSNAVPKYFLIGPEGKILLRPESPQVDTKSFIEEVLKNRKT